MSSQLPKRFTLKAPSVGMHGGAITCETTRSVLRITPDGLLVDLTEEQAIEFLGSGWVPVEGRAVLDLRRLADAYARSAAAFATAEDAAAAAIRAARAEGLSEESIGEILSSAGKAHQTVLPGAADIAGPVPAVEKKAPAPAVEPPAPKVEPPAPKVDAPETEKKAGGKKSLSATAQESAAKKSDAAPAEAPAPAVEPPPPAAPQE